MTGVQTCALPISIPAAHGGQDCQANDEETEATECNEQVCDVDCVEIGRASCRERV